MTKNKFSAEYWKLVVIKLIEAPPSQMEEYVRDILRSCVNGTPQELYDGMAKVGALPTVKSVDGQYSFGDVSEFVKGVCNVKEYYERPAE